MIKCELQLFLTVQVFSTQLPHAVGAAYSLKMDQKNACAVTYFGDGGTSEVNEQMLGCIWMYFKSQ